MFLRLAGIASMLTLWAAPAFAEEREHYYRPPSTVPEIDAGQGLAAIAILICVALLSREYLIRHRPVKS